AACVGGFAARTRAVPAALCLLTGCGRVLPASRLLAAAPLGSGGAIIGRSAIAGATGPAALASIARGRAALALAGSALATLPTRFRRQVGRAAAAQRITGRVRRERRAAAAATATTATTARLPASAALQRVPRSRQREVHAAICAVTTGASGALRITL